MSRAGPGVGDGSLPPAEQPAAPFHGRSPPHRVGGGGGRATRRVSTGRTCCCCRPCSTTSARAVRAITRHGCRPVPGIAATLRSQRSRHRDPGRHPDPASPAASQTAIRRDLDDPATVAGDRRRCRQPAGCLSCCMRCRRPTAGPPGRPAGTTGAPSSSTNSSGEPGRARRRARREHDSRGGVTGRVRQLAAIGSLDGHRPLDRRSSPDLPWSPRPARPAVAARLACWP